MESKDIVMLGKLCEAFKHEMLKIFGIFGKSYFSPNAITLDVYQSITYMFIEVDIENGPRLILKDCELSFPYSDYLSKYPTLRVEGF